MTRWTTAKVPGSWSVRSIYGQFNRRGDRALPLPQRGLVVWVQFDCCVQAPASVVFM